MTSHLPSLVELVASSERPETFAARLSTLALAEPTYNKGCEILTAYLLYLATTENKSNEHLLAVVADYPLRTETITQMAQTKNDRIGRAAGISREESPKHLEGDELHFAMYLQLRSFCDWWH